MIVEPDHLRIEKEDLISHRWGEGNKPEIHILNGDYIFRITFEDQNSFEYFALKLGRLAESYRCPKMRTRLETSRMKAILLEKDMDRLIKTRTRTR